MNNARVGGYPVPTDIANEVQDLIARIQEKYKFNHGSTAAFWAVMYTLSSHVGEGLE